MDGASAVSVYRFWIDLTEELGLDEVSQQSLKSLLKIYVYWKGFPEFSFVLILQFFIVSSCFIS